MIELKNISKIYYIGDVKVTALNDVSFTCEKGEFISIMGHSGSGKSTMMNILGCLDRPTSGSYIIDGVDVAGMADEPTGNLDTQMSHNIMSLLVDQSKKGITIIVVTHEEDIAAYTRRNIYLRDGSIIEEKKR